MPSTPASENPYLLTLPQLISAKKKIGKVATFYDPKKSSFKGFDSQALTPTEFREQLRRNFLVKLSDDELGAIVVLFDKDGDREIDSSEFINEFFKLGKQEKSKFYNNQKERNDIESKRKAKRMEDHEQKYIEKNKTNFPEKWTKEEEESAIRKVAKVAFTYKPMNWLGGGLKGFYSCGALNPAQFREQMKQNFEILLSPGEVSALMNIFDKDKNGEIDCAEFLYAFFRMGRNEKDRHMMRQIKLTQKKNHEETKRKDQVTQNFQTMAKAKIIPATDDDKKIALQKITHAASIHQGSIMNGVKSFDSKDMTPEAFREQLKRQFFITLSPGELDAMIQLFDTNGDGEISSVEFLTTFFRIGSKEKRKNLLYNRKIKEKRKVKEEQRVLEKTSRLLNSTKTRVNWPKLPEDFNINDEMKELEEMSMTLSINACELNSPTATGASPLFSPISERRKTRRKPLLSESLSSSLTSEHGQEVSVLSMFPKASEATKDFIKYIEEEEEKIMSTYSSDKTQEEKSPDTKNSNELKGSDSYKITVTNGSEETVSTNDYFQDDGDDFFK